MPLEEKNHNHQKILLLHQDTMKINLKQHMTKKRWMKSLVHQIKTRGKQSCSQLLQRFHLMLICIIGKMKSLKPPPDLRKDNTLSQDIHLVKIWCPSFEDSMIEKFVTLEHSWSYPCFLNFFRVKPDAHRFWVSSAEDRDEMRDPDGDACLRTRVIEFTGDFEKVKWTCRAPLTNGKLCPRQDRVKVKFLFHDNTDTIVQFHVYK